VEAQAAMNYFEYVATLFDEVERWMKLRKDLPVNASNKAQAQYLAEHYDGQPELPFWSIHSQFTHRVQDWNFSGNGTGPVVEETAALAELELPDLPEEALDTRLGQICLDEMADLPRAYAWPALLAAAGVLVPESSQSYVRTNLYVALVGPVGSGKTESIKRACAILDVREPELVDAKCGSAEGLIKLIGTPGKPRLYFPDELSHLLAKSAIDRASFPAILQTLWSRSTTYLTVAHQKQIPFDAALSIAGGISEEKFQEGFNHTTTGGLYDRFVFSLFPSGFHFDWQPWEGSAVADTVCEVRVHGSVWEAKRGWMKEDEELRDRIAENAIRSAVICAAWDKRSELKGEHLAPALELAKYQVRVRSTLKPNPGENYDAKCAFAVIAVLEKSQSQWVKERDVYKSIHAERLGPGVFDRALLNLEFTEQIERSKSRPKAVRLKPFTETAP
jgi:hypothetical protein